MSIKVGIQLFSVRNAMAKNPIDTIDQVAAMGYKCLEVANHNATQDFGVGFPADADSLLESMKKHGASILSAHLFPLNLANVRDAIAWHQKIGTKYLINPAIFTGDYDEMMKNCEEFNAVGRICKEAGMQFCYHNHFHEFARIRDDKTMMAFILDNTDPDVVGIELDTYWALRGGVDPVQFIKTYGKRIPLLHQKDLIKDLKEPVNILEKVPEGKVIDMNVFNEVFDRTTVVEIGTGCMDIQSIIDAATTYANVEAIILEQDNTTMDEMDSIRLSMQEFKKFKGVDWS